MPRQRDFMELIRQQASMSKQIVSQKDKEYGYYAGATFDDARKMAMIDLMLNMGIFPSKFIPILKFYRAYLNQRRKAFFASVGASEISVLGFILGLEDESIHAGKL